MDESLTCDFCGDAFVSWPSHVRFCKGFAGKPWVALPPNAKRLALWSKLPAFLRWAREHNWPLRKLMV